MPVAYSVDSNNSESKAIFTQKESTYLDSCIKQVFLSKVDSLLVYGGLSTPDNSFLVAEYQSIAKHPVAISKVKQEIDLAAKETFDYCLAGLGKRELIKKAKDVKINVNLQEKNIILNLNSDNLNLAITETYEHNAGIQLKTANLVSTKLKSHLNLKDFVSEDINFGLIPYSSDKIILSMANGFDNDKTLNRVYEGDYANNKPEFSCQDYVSVEKDSNSKFKELVENPILVLDTNNSKTIETDSYILTTNKAPIVIHTNVIEQAIVIGETTENLPEIEIKVQVSNFKDDAFQNCYDPNYNIKINFQNTNEGIAPILDISSIVALSELMKNPNYVPYLLTPVAIGLPNDRLITIDSELEITYIENYHNAITILKPGTGYVYPGREVGLLKSALANSIKNYKTDTEYILQELEVILDMEYENSAKQTKIEKQIEALDKTLAFIENSIEDKELKSTFSGKMLLKQLGRLEPNYKITENGIAIASEEQEEEYNEEVKKIIQKVDLTTKEYASLNKLLTKKISLKNSEKEILSKINSEQNKLRTKQILDYQASNYQALNQAYQDFYNKKYLESDKLIKLNELSVALLKYEIDDNQLKESEQKHNLYYINLFQLVDIYRQEDKIDEAINALKLLDEELTKTINFMLNQLRDDSEEKQLANYIKLKSVVNNFLPFIEQANSKEVYEKYKSEEKEVQLNNEKIMPKIESIVVDDDSPIQVVQTNYFEKEIAVVINGIDSSENMHLLFYLTDSFNPSLSDNNSITEIMLEPEDYLKIEGNELGNDTIRIQLKVPFAGNNYGNYKLGVKINQNNFTAERFWYYSDRDKGIIRVLPEDSQLEQDLSNYLGEETQNNYQYLTVPSVSQSTATNIDYSNLAKSTYSDYESEIIKSNFNIDTSFGGEISDSEKDEIYDATIRLYHNKQKYDKEKGIEPYYNAIVDYYVLLEKLYHGQESAEELRIQLLNEDSQKIVNNFDTEINNNIYELNKKKILYTLSVVSAAYAYIYDENKQPLLATTVAQMGEITTRYTNKKPVKETISPANNDYATQLLYMNHPYYVYLVEKSAKYVEEETPRMFKHVETLFKGKIQQNNDVLEKIDQSLSNLPGSVIPDSVWSYYDENDFSETYNTAKVLMESSKYLKKAADDLCPASNYFMKHYKDIEKACSLIQSERVDNTKIYELAFKGNDNKLDQFFSEEKKDVKKVSEDLDTFWGTYLIEEVVATGFELAMFGGSISALSKISKLKKVMPFIQGAILISIVAGIPHVYNQMSSACWGDDMTEEEILKQGENYKTNQCLESVVFVAVLMAPIGAWSTKKVMDFSRATPKISEIVKPKLKVGTNKPGLLRKENIYISEHAQKTIETEGLPFSTVKEALATGSKQELINQKGLFAHIKKNPESYANGEKNVVVVANKNNEIKQILIKSDKELDSFLIQQTKKTGANSETKSKIIMEELKAGLSSKTGKIKGFFNKYDSKVNEFSKTKKIAKISTKNKLKANIANLKQKILDYRASKKPVNQKLNDNKLAQEYAKTENALTYKSISEALSTVEDVPYKILSDGRGYSYTDKLNIQEIINENLLSKGDILTVIYNKGYKTQKYLLKVESVSNEGIKVSQLIADTEHYLVRNNLQEISKLNKLLAERKVDLTLKPEKIEFSQMIKQENVDKMGSSSLKNSDKSIKIIDIESKTNFFEKFSQIKEFNLERRIQQIKDLTASSTKSYGQTYNFVKDSAKQREIIKNLALQTRHMPDEFFLIAKESGLKLVVSDETKIMTSFAGGFVNTKQNNIVMQSKFAESSEGNIFIHEFGHYFHFSATNKAGWVENLKAYNYAIGHDETLSLLPQSYTKAKHIYFPEKYSSDSYKTISEYSLTNEYEHFAEMFTRWFGWKEGSPSPQYLGSNRIMNKVKFAREDLKIRNPQAYNLMEGLSGSERSYLLENPSIQQGFRIRRNKMYSTFAKSIGRALIPIGAGYYGYKLIFDSSEEEPPVSNNIPAE